MVWSALVPVKGFSQRPGGQIKNNGDRIPTTPQRSFFLSAAESLLESAAATAPAAQIQLQCRISRHTMVRDCWGLKR